MASKSQDDIVTPCCEAWNKLIKRPWKIMSIELWDWAHEIWSMQVSIALH